ncbi:DUF6778 family protein [Marivita hallyeonensis]|uniref:Lipoprotein n=1 Tax=Marivita hallyeonensis TaxID=996342 RepID=A0A1M5S062_9RHOB|nr:DUF6778 family protein [Marivita hallyeonensis]SHH32012.1 hypothetical protein SAMN05443551_1962 [Marivita hallyeonensis]
MKQIIKPILALCLAAVLTACGNSNFASRAAMPDDTMLGNSVPDVRIESFTVSVPNSLTVNERNLYYPVGDIVWRGDPRGDRRQQVKAIFETGVRAAAQLVEGNRPVRMDVQVTRFHALSEKARYITGGVHDIDFKYRLIDTETGLQIGETKDVNADLEALAGRRAIDAEQQGLTQKSRITAHLAEVIQTELSVPGGYKNRDLGILQVINQIR